MLEIAGEIQQPPACRRFILTLPKRGQSMKAFIYNSTSEEDTAKLGHALAAALPPGTVVALNGPLGAGKTRLVQAVAEALGIDRHEVVSPTFVLLQEHHGNRRGLAQFAESSRHKPPPPNSPDGGLAESISIYHVDAYRIRDDDEFMQLGMEEYFASGGLVFIEWANRVAMCLPPDIVTITIEVTDDTSRRFIIDGPSALDSLASLER